MSLSPQGAVPSWAPESQLCSAVSFEAKACHKAATVLRERAKQAKESADEKWKEAKLMRADKRVPKEEVLQVEEEAKGKERQAARHMAQAEVQIKRAREVVRMIPDAKLQEEAIR